MKDKEKSPRLGSYFEAPEFLRVPYILSGYRLNHTIVDCCRSLIHIHNETVNTWSHALGGFFMVYFMYHLIFFDYSKGIMNLLMPMTYDFACAYSLVASAIFHGFNCVSEKHHYNLRILDFCGIGVGILGSSAPIVYYIFFCSPISLAIWLTIVGILFPLFFWMPFATFFHDKRILRTLLFVFGSLIPFFSWSQYLIMYGYNNVMHELLFSKVMISYLCYGFGIVLYVVRAPERFAPGYFDNLGTSHQIWHALVCLGMFNLHYSVYTTRDFRLANDFECLIFP